jgi:D-3-phosphoglycerate dehydrogenase
MFGAAEIAQLKPGARLINAAHGSIWDEAAVAEALKSGTIAGVATDVYSAEPPYSSPLVGLENVVHTPHIGDNTFEAAQDLSCQSVTQVLDALRGVDYRHVVNMPFLPGAPYEYAQPYLRLAECMGSVMHHLARHPVVRIEVEYRGAEMDGLVKPLTVALLKGLLAPVLGESVNYINAPVLASERGNQEMQTKGLKTEDYTTLVSCQTTLEDGEEIIMAGTLLDRKEPHIVQINE